MHATCPLCARPDSRNYYQDSRRTYLQCTRCALVFVPARYHLSPAQEKAEYDKHCNSVDDPGYRRFLNRLAQPLIDRLRPASRGLEFGCGPGPALADMLQRAGFDIHLYDPIYHPDKAALQQDYDFISATEVVEHLAHPARELELLWRILQPGGTLGLMTKLLIDRDRFADWHYIRDPTHIAFYSRETFRWLASEKNARLSFIGNDVILLEKS